MTQTDYYVQRVLDAVFHGVSFTVGQAYVGLATGTNINNLTELTAADYTRKVVTWSAVSDDSIDSAAKITWSPTSDWGVVTMAFLSDASQGGNILFYDAIGSVPMSSGSQTFIDPGNLLVT